MGAVEGIRDKNPYKEAERVANSETEKQEERLPETASRTLVGKTITRLFVPEDAETAIFARVKRPPV